MCHVLTYISQLSRSFLVRSIFLWTRYESRNLELVDIFDFGSLLLHQSIICVKTQMNTPNKVTTCVKCKLLFQVISRNVIVLVLTFVAIASPCCQLFLLKMQTLMYLCAE